MKTVEIKNATSKESKIIQNRLHQSGLIKHIRKVVVVNNFVNSYMEKYYSDFEMPEGETRMASGAHLFDGTINKSDILISSINFTSKNQGKIFSFEDSLLHELGHVYHLRHHKFDKFLSKTLPKSRMLRYISKEVYANAFLDVLKGGKVNQKEILINAKRNMNRLIDDYIEIIDSGDIPVYIYTIDGYSIVTEDEE